MTDQTTTDTAAANAAALRLETAKTDMELANSNRELAALASSRHRSIRRWNIYLIIMNLFVVVAMLILAYNVMDFVSAFLNGIKH